MTKRLFESTEAFDSLGRLVVDLVTNGFAVPLTFALLAPDGTALTGTYRDENGRLVCEPTSGLLPVEPRLPSLLVGLFVDYRGKTVVLRIDDGQARPILS